MDKRVKIESDAKFDLRIYGVAGLGKITNISGVQGWADQCIPPLGSEHRFRLPLRPTLNL